MSKARSGIGEILLRRGAQRARNKISTSHLWTGTAGAPGFASTKVAIMLPAKPEGKSSAGDTNSADRGDCSEIER
jgi:hypothetical protein